MITLQGSLCIEEREAQVTFLFLPSNVFQILALKKLPFLFKDILLDMFTLWSYLT